MYLEVHEVDQRAVHVHHEPLVPHEQGMANGEVKESYKPHQIDQHSQEVVLDAL
jgi:hypothetical protein